MALTPTQLAALTAMKDNSALEDIFFGRCRDSAFFAPLQERGYFDPSRAPGPQAVDDKGSVRIPYWNVLDYLEHVSERKDQDDYQELVRELLEIITAVSTRQDEAGKHIDNYHTWKSFVRILSNIPNESISEEILSFLPIWLDSKFDDSLVGAEVAERLVPKFLFNTDPDSQRKAAAVIEHLMDIREPQDGPGVDRKCKTKVNSYWLLELFVSGKIAEKIRTSCSEPIIRIVANILLKVLFAESIRRYDFEVQGKIYRSELRAEDHTNLRYRFGQIQSEGLTPEIRYWEAMGLETLDIKWLFDFTLEAVTDSNLFLAALRGCCENDALAANLLQNVQDHNLLALYEDVFLDYSYIWYTSLATDEGHIGEARQVLTRILVQLLIDFAKRESQKTAQMLGEFLSERYPFPIFGRVSIFVLGGNWAVAEFAPVREAIFKKRTPLMLSSIYYEREFSALLEKHATILSPEEQNSLVASIEAGPVGITADATPVQLDYWRQRWYHALRGLPECLERYARLKDHTKTETEPSFQTKSMVGHGRSPLSQEEVAALSGPALAQYLLGFKGRNAWTDPTVNALAERLRSAFYSESESMVTKLKDFEDKRISYIYVSHLLWGLQDAAKEARFFDWGMVFSFLTKYLDQEGFWEDALRNEDDSYSAGHAWVIAQIGNLISDTVSENPAAFPDSAVDSARALLATIVERLSPSEQQASDSPVERTLNSTPGKILQAIIALSWKKAHIDRERNGGNLCWDAVLKSLFDNCLEEKWVDAYTVLGWRFAICLELDAEWTTDRATQYANLPEEFWHSFMYGYLTGGAGRTVPLKPLYLLMIPNYERALETTIAGRYGEESLVQHIGWEYVDEFLPTDHSLYLRLLSQWRLSRIQHLADLWWSNREPWEMALRDKLPASGGGRARFRNKVLGFWERLYDHYSGAATDNPITEVDKKLLSHTARLAVFLPEINAKYQPWLLQIAPHVLTGGDSMFFIEYLNLLKDVSEDKAGAARRLAEIYACMLESGTPDYDKKNILATVAFMYDFGDFDTKPMANDIVNKYEERGYSFLGQLYVQHNE